MSTSQVPTKRIVSKAHLEVWLASPAHADVLAFVEQLNESVVGVKLTDEVAESDATTALVSLLDEVEGIIKATPPVDNGLSRFGNPAFRTFYDQVASRSNVLHDQIPELDKAFIPELSVYLCESWGNRTRVDYGSGMELNFLCWLLCLQKLGVLKKEDSTAVVTKVFWKYMRIARLLQTEYWLEPAGSHGAQGLDDYHFAVFIFGSAQLRGHKYLRPKAIHDSEILEEFSKDYMYLSYVRYINSIKTASLRWHSPMLDDISGVKTWDKVNSGMLKMYAAEVLAKLPVAQHFLFGSLLPYPSTPELDAAEAGHEHGEGCTHDHSHSHAHEHANGDQVMRNEDGTLHIHALGEAPSCCPRIPAVFGAGSGGNVRRIPFD
ncbi:hypothetical protein JCM11251_007770 [Rhodosporidiobolus azoricus]